LAGGQILNHQFTNARGEATLPGVDELLGHCAESRGVSLFGEINDSHVGVVIQDRQVSQKLPLKLAYSKRKNAVV
jgi:hypothetical protein